MTGERAADSPTRADQPRAAGARRRVARLAARAWFPAAIAFCYLYSFPYFEGIRSANELPRIYLTMAIVERGALNIGPEMWRHHISPDTSVHRARLYCNKAPGVSFLAVPVYGVLWLANGANTPELRQVFFWCRLVLATLPSLLFLALLARFLREIVPRRSAARLVLAGYALGSMALVYGTLLMAHQLAAALIASAMIVLFFDARRGASRWWAPLVAGVLAGLGVLVDYQAAFVGPPLFLYALYRGRPRLRGAALFAAGSMVGLGALMLYQWACFDDPFSTPYHHLAHPLFRGWVNQGFLGIKGFSLASFIDRHFSADDGLFYYAPFLLLAFPGVLALAMRRGLRAEALLCAAVIALYAYFVSSVTLVSGWDVGPRYVICALPFWTVAVAALVAALDGRWYFRAVPYGLVVASVAIYLSVAAVFPHYPENFSNPLFDLTLRFAGAGYTPYNLGWLVGLEGWPSLLPLALVAGATLLALSFGERRRHPDPGAAGWRGGLVRRAATVALALATAVAVLSFHYRGLAHRHRPVPEEFIPWLERIWEPRHARMSPAKLLRRIGPAPRRPPHRRR